MKTKLFMAVGIFIFLVLLGGVTFISFEQQGLEDKGKPVLITFLQTKNDADCTVITQGNTTIMIDTGEAEDADAILQYLKENKIQTLQYLILSHPDKDHIGGTNTILQEIPAERIIRPYYEGDKTGWEDLNAIIPTHTYQVKIADMELIFYPPLEKHYQDSNNYSMAVLLRHHNVTALFPGDAIKKRTEELLNIDLPNVDLYKAAHHGRQNKYSADLIQKIKPNYMIVTSSQADTAVLEACEKEEGIVLYTRDGTKQFISDGVSATYQTPNKGEIK